MKFEVFNLIFKLKVPHLNKMPLSSLPTEEGGGDSLTCNCGATHVKSTPITLYSDFL